MKSEKKRVHLVNLLRWRSIVTLAMCITVLICSMGSIYYALMVRPLEAIRTIFEWFTVDANLLNALASVMIIPFAIEGIRKKRLTYPKWAQRIHYAGVICLAITLVFAVCFISTYDKKLAFGGENFFLHIVCPVMVIASFFLTESNAKLDRKDNLLALLPFVSYAVMYLFHVVIAGDWEDHYMLNTYAPFYVSLPVMCLMAYATGWIIRILYNRWLAHREKQLRRIWGDDPDPVTVRIEIYSLGIHAGMHEDRDNPSIPIDILKDVADQFDLKLYDLARAYIKGVLDGQTERKDNG